MSRIATRFARDASASGAAGLVAYVTAGDPDLRALGARSCVALARGGADVLEVGVPFSDPLADGPVIQRATERALAAGTTLRGVLDWSRERARDDRRADRALHLRQPGRADGRRRVRARAPPTPASTACCARLPVEEAEPLRSAAGRRRARSDLPVSPTTTRRADPAVGGARAAGSCTSSRGSASPARATRVAATPSRCWPAHPGAVDAAGGLGFGISRRSTSPRSPLGRRGGGRQRAGEGDREHGGAPDVAARAGELRAHG